MKGISLFASGGVGETYLKELGIDIIAANELLEKRADAHSKFHPETEMICGDITKKEIKDKINGKITSDVKFLIATPPCQGLSSLGKNKLQKDFEDDSRNYLIFHTFEIMDKNDFEFILIENVPKFLTMYFPYKGEYLLLEDILKIKYGEKYNIDIDVLNAKDYGVPQSRPRAIIKLYKKNKNLSWSWPKKEKEILLKDAIGHLPTLESDEDSGIKWHKAKWHNDREILAMKNTPTGKSAMVNEIFYPKKIDGARVKGFHNTYKRLNWEVPCHARTTNSGNIGSHNNVHPGRKLEDGTYSDARVLTLLETFIVSSLPEDWNVPDECSETFVRHIIGESIPPLMLKRILEPIFKENKLN